MTPQAADALVVDDSYHLQRNILRQTQVKSAKKGLMMGVEALGSGIREGAKGVLLKPLHGAMDEGAQGFAKGVVHGLVGAVAMPLSGAATLASKTTEGMASDARRAMVGTRLRDKMLIRVRQPRLLGANAVLLPYDPGVVAAGEARLDRTPAPDEDSPEAVESEMASFR